MAENWTPGPWKRDGSLGMVKTENRKLVAVVYGDDSDCKPDARMVANVRLIAQAPAMAEALERLAQLFDLRGVMEVEEIEIDGKMIAPLDLGNEIRAILSAIKGE